MKIKVHKGITDEVTGEALCGPCLHVRFDKAQQINSKMLNTLMRRLRKLRGV